MEPQTCYIEIRGATGGDEAKIWGGDLLRMYLRFATKKGWKVLSQLANDYDSYPEEASQLALHVVQ